MNINSKCITLASGGNKKGILEFLENDYVEVPDSLLYPKGIMHFSKRNQQTTWNILTLFSVSPAVRSGRSEDQFAPLPTSVPDSRMKIKVWYDDGFLDHCTIKTKKKAKTFINEVMANIQDQFCQSSETLGTRFLIEVLLFYNIYKFYFSPLIIVLLVHLFCSWLKLNI